MEIGRQTVGKVHAKCPGVTSREIFVTTLIEVGTILGVSSTFLFHLNYFISFRFLFVCSPSYSVFHEGVSLVHSYDF